MNGQRALPEGLRALQSALADAGDAQIVRIVDLVDTLDRRDAETILAPIRARLRLLRLQRPLQLSRLLGLPLEPLLVDAARWRPSAAALPRASLQPFCDAIAVRSPELIDRVQAMVAGVNSRETARVHVAGSLFWPGAGAALMSEIEPPDSWTKAGLTAANFRQLAAAAGVCLAATLPLEALGDPTMNRVEMERTLSALLRQATVVGPLAWSMLVVVMFCALPEAQAPRDAVLNQGSTELRLPAEAALQQIWAWIEAAGVTAPSNLNDAAAALRARAAVLNALATSKSQRPRAAVQQADLRDAYTQYLAEAAQTRLITTLGSLTKDLSDPAMVAMEEHARGLRRLLIEIRSLGGSAADGVPLQQAVQAACQCAALRPIDRARLVERLGYPEIAAKLVGS